MVFLAGFGGLRKGMLSNIKDLLFIHILGMGGGIMKGFLEMPGVDCYLACLYRKEFQDFEITIHLSNYFGVEL